ncbi:DUF4062 domain-containing protein [Hymenobacter chitinivorans]|uniref:Uncharacterized protein DUF4062 n=1 Tax=Hymenobacter chitinivorans DSM 11115 TaxID=1121954 RepID=A0A2M9B500_9BACT|nr:DUF4062 domain-containing protein [Hymenobacter chitinivorans]PJJ53027.1 uncharacterized protein DUF4062 [Hymenobacter chitinivorans DSM 11115]
MAKKYQVFISSTFDDLKEHRDAVVKAVLQLGHLPVGMEMFNAGDQTQWETIRSYIDSSDYYLVVLAHRYGSIDPGSGLSYTEQEYDYAGEQGIPRLGFVIDKNAQWPASQVEAKAKKKLDAFKSKVGKARVIKFWDTTDKLAYHISLSLSNEIAINPRTGWVRATEAASPQVAEELARLIKENKKFQAQIAESQLNSKIDVLKKVISETYITSDKDHAVKVNLYEVFMAVSSLQPDASKGGISNEIDKNKGRDDNFYNAIENALKELVRLGLTTTETMSSNQPGLSQWKEIFAYDVWKLTEKGSELYTLIRYSHLK